MSKAKVELNFDFQNSPKIEFRSNVDETRCIEKLRPSAFQCTHFHQNLTKTLFSVNFESQNRVSNFQNFTGLMVLF